MHFKMCTNVRVCSPTIWIHHGHVRRLQGPSRGMDSPQPAGLRRKQVAKAWSFDRFFHAEILGCTPLKTNMSPKKGLV